MAPHKLKVVRIGNSRGVRLPAGLLKRYLIGDSVLMEERDEGILLRPTGPSVPRLSWKETARAMALGDEDWSSWDALSGDGLDRVPWTPGKVRRVAESKSEYQSHPKKRRT